jgi:hypothetical protein
MATAEHREPCDSRGSCTVLGAPGGEIPSGDSTWAAVQHNARMLQHCLSKQTLCPRDCKPLECQKPTFTVPTRQRRSRPEFKPCRRHGAACELLSRHEERSVYTTFYR